MKRFINSFLKAYLFWLVFFAFFRTLFIIVNRSFIEDTPITVLLASYWPGLRMDMSFAGYLMLMVIVAQLFSLPFWKKFCFRCFKWLYYFLIPLFVGLLLGDINLFRYWAGHLNKEAISFLKTPDIIFNSIHWGEALLFFILWIVISWVWIFLFNKFVLKIFVSEKYGYKRIAVNWFYTLFLGAFMIVPIRGSFTVAPINTSVAYFSNYLFANNAAVNPLWNLAYSMKRNAITHGGYHFMDDQQAQDRFDDMMHESGNFPKILNSEKPNIVVILLESFSAQAVKKLGGQDVTPNLNKLIKEGIFFSNLYSTSFRSDYGIVGVLTGYPGVPGYSVMQYPEKSRHLNFIPHKLKMAGYKDFNFLYGGDMAFKNMKSLIVLSGFNNITSMDDFPANYRGKKWGVHDQYTFEELLNILENSNDPSFSFFFTLSSHEPFDVPMERVVDDDYLNSVYYTDRCLGHFFDEVKKRQLWENTLFILVADHGVVGPEKLGYTNARRYHIPMLWTGGAVAVRDTVIDTFASQIDIAATLLNQLNIDASDFKFSKNILDESVKGFAFMHYPDGFGLIDKSVFQMYNKNNGSVEVMSGAKTREDSLKAKVWMQIIAKDFKERLSNERK